MDLAGEILRIFFVLALAWAMAWLVFRAPWRGPGIRGRRSRLKVVEAVGLGRQRLACILEVEGQRLLLGVSDGGVTLLKELGNSPDDEGVEAGSGRPDEGRAREASRVAKGFEAALRRFLKYHGRPFEKRAGR